MSGRPLLFVDHSTALGGAERSLLLLLECLDRERFAPHLATRAGVLADAARARGTIVHEVPLARLRRQPGALWRLAHGVAGLMAIIRRERIAVVYSNTMRASVYAAVAARLSRRPLVWHVRDIIPPGLYSRVMCGLSDAAIAVSAAVAARLPCADTVRVIPNAVRVEDFQASRTIEARRLRAAWGIPADALLVGHVARLQPWKGQMDFVAAAEAVLRDLPDTYFAIVGGDIFGDAGSYEQELRAMVTHHELAHRVILTGHQTDVAATLGAIDVIVHASKDEPFGRVLIEAGAAGLPVVAFASGGVVEIIVHERTGLLVPPGDIGALADGLRCLLKAPSYCRSLGNRARALVTDRFDIRRITRETESLLQEFMEA